MFNLAISSIGINSFRKAKAGTGSAGRTGIIGVRLERLNHRPTGLLPYVFRGRLAKRPGNTTTT